MINALDTIYHTFSSEGRLCEVWKDFDGSWVTRHYTVTKWGKIWKKDVIHAGHSEQWAEDAAENWVLEINS